MKRYGRIEGARGKALARKGSSRPWGACSLGAVHVVIGDAHSGLRRPVSSLSIQSAVSCGIPAVVGLRGRLRRDL